MAMTEQEIETARREGRKVLYTAWHSGKRVRGSVVKTHSESPFRNDDVMYAEIHDGRILEPGGYQDISWEDLELAPPEIQDFRVQFDVKLNTDDLRNAEGVEIPRRPLMGPDYEKFVRDRVYQFLETLHQEWQETANMSNVRVDTIYPESRRFR